MSVSNDQLTLDHMLSLRDGIATIEAQEMDLFEIVSAIPREFFEGVLPPNFSWAGCYELPVKHHVASLFWSLGCWESLASAINDASNSNDAVIAFVHQFMADGGILADWFADGPPESVDDIKHLRGGPGGMIAVQDIGGLAYALWAQVFALRKFGKFMSDLVAEMKQGKDESFVHAVLVDPTVLSSPSFARRLSIAFVRQETDFFDALAKALKSNGPRSDPKLDPLRVILNATLEAGILNTLGMDEADQLFIRELQVYSDDGEDPARSLWRFIDRWKSQQ